MEPAVAAAAYGAETAVEGGVGAGIAIAKKTMPLKANWKRLPLDDVQLPVSSHSFSIVKHRAYLWGGERAPRELVDNTMHILTLPQSEHDPVDYQSIPPNNPHESEVP